MKKVLIIGGGASGMAAAIAAARNGASVTILEHMDRIGKKILSTGNGKCNYTNHRQGLRFYRGENPAFVLPVFRQFGFEETVAFFRELGIYPKERDGYFYPASGQAASVLDALRMELRRLRLQVVTGCNLTSVQKEGAFFKAVAGTKAYYADCCIFACGGMAFPKSGSDGSAFSFIRQFGHTFVQVVPALVQLKASQPFFKSIAGVRTDASVKLYVEQKLVCEDRGEVQLTDCGISGIPVFQVSRYAAKALGRGERVHAALDFVPFLGNGDLFWEVKGRFMRGDGKTAEEALVGLFSKKLIPVFLKQNGIILKGDAAAVPEGKLRALCGYLKEAWVDIIGTKGFEAAQVSAGGIDTREICAETMESVLEPGLYFAGEVVDVDGMCGGYNLQWAWSSGYVAGSHAAVG
ncbi:MAG: aminoacetone oxidase family FAD-binding enzyme [Eubacterium sp.]|nr:aminoacetone oxidase family FAD-binding enzyme [Eubacterium sp.]NBI86346.1 aminoacetone oxidase family FAD-binding enzyme [Lachnospiraceae bacterium]